MKIQNQHNLSLEQLKQLVEREAPEYRCSISNGKLTIQKTFAIKLVVSVRPTHFIIDEKQPYYIILLMLCGAVGGVLLRNVILGFFLALSAGILPYYLFFRNEFKELVDTVVNLILFPYK